MPKPMFLKSFKCPAQGKYIELTPPPGHLSLTHPPHKDPKRAQNPLPHAYEQVPRSELTKTTHSKTTATTEEKKRQSQTQPPQKNPKRALNPLPHAYDLVPRSELTKN